MFSIILWLLFIQRTVSSSTINPIADEILNKFIDEIDDETNIQDWMENRNHTTLSDQNLFKEVVRNVSDVLSVINLEKYADIKSLIYKTNMYLGEMPFPYLKSWYIIESINNILLSTYENSALYIDTCQTNGFNEIFLFEEYDNIKNNIDKSIINVGYQLNRYGELDSIIETLEEWVLSNFKEEKKIKDSTDLFIKIINIIKSSNNQLESILPSCENAPVYVKAHSEGFKKCRKISKNGITRFSKNGSKKFFTNQFLKFIQKCSRKLFFPNQVNIEDYMNQIFLCNRPTANILICLFHYYSEIKGTCTMYEVSLIDYDEYQIKWSFNGLSPKERIKKKILNQEIPDLSSKIKIHKFGLIIDFDIEYSTIKSDDTIGEPIETRLILLSCGHQLGLELIDEFFEHFFDFKTKTSTCHICRQAVEIIGSYDAVVYRCK